MKSAKYAMVLITLAGVFAMSSSAAFAADAEAPAGEKPAGEKPTKKVKPLHGVIKKVDGNAITLSVGKGDKQKEVTVETDSNTKITVDNQPAKLADLKEGDTATVTPSKGTAEHVEVTKAKQ